MSKFGVTLGPSTRAEAQLSDPESLLPDREARLPDREARLSDREARLPGGGAPLARGVSVGGVIAGKYRIERVIGHGGMGVVVAASQLALQRTVAIKLIRGDWADDPLAVERLVREARALASIQSQHVARVLDVGTLDDGIPFIVMEYLEGHDLDTLLRRDGALPVSTAIDYLLQACEALAEAHRNGIVHRDIKPANLFLARQPSGVPCIKVVDFGISKLINSGSVESLTHPSRIVGSLYHMAPEQLSGEPVDARTDVWALGVLSFELLTGRKPFQGGAWPAVCARVLSDTEPPESLGAHVPGELQSAVRRCLQRNPEERFPNVAELAVALSPFGTRSARVSLEHIVRLATSTGSLAAESYSPLPPGLGGAPRRDREQPSAEAAAASGEAVLARSGAERRAAGAPRRMLPAPAPRRPRSVRWLVVAAAALVVVGVPWLVTRLLHPAAPEAPPAELLAELPPPEPSRRTARDEVPPDGVPLDGVDRVPPGRPSLAESVPALLPQGPSLAEAVRVPPPGSAPRAETAPGGGEPSSGRILVPVVAEQAPSPHSLQLPAAPPGAAPRVRVVPESELVALPPRAVALPERAAAHAPPAAVTAGAPAVAAPAAGAAAVQKAPAQASPRGADPWDFRDLEFE